MPCAHTLQVSHIESQTIEQLLTRIDEFGKLVSLLQADAQHRRALLPLLATHTAALEHTFASIDAASNLVALAVSHLRTLDERVSRAERDLTAISLDPRNVVSAKRRAAAIAHGLGVGARDDTATLLVPPAFLSSHPVFDRQNPSPPHPNV